MSIVVEEDNIIENDYKKTYYKILNIIDDGELRTDWHLVNVSELTMGKEHFKGIFTPWLRNGDGSWQILFWINQQYFHISVARQNNNSNEGIEIKFDTYFYGSNQLGTEINEDDCDLNVVEGLNVQTISKCFVNEKPCTDPSSVKDYEFEFNGQWIHITIMCCVDAAKIDFYTSFEKGKNQIFMSYTIHNGEADYDDAAMRFDPEWREEIDPYDGLFYEYT